jgi:membrane-associated phospholipid phosphatase
MSHDGGAGARTRAEPKATATTRATVAGATVAGATVTGATVRRAARAALPDRLRGPLLLVAAFGAALLALLAVVYAGDSAPGRLDDWAQSFVDERLPAPGSFALFVDSLGEPAGRAAAVAAVTLLCLVLQHWRLAATVLAASAVVTVMTEVLKPVVDRRIHEGYLSYPSGHLAIAVALSMVVGLLMVDVLGLRRTAGTVVVLATAAAGGAVMFWSQIALTAHYPTDGVGGVCCALAVVPPTAWLVDRAADGVRARRALRAEAHGPGHEPVALASRRPPR